MRKIFLLLIFSTSIYATEILEVHVYSKSNDRNEAKISGTEEALTRAFLLLMDRFNLNDAKMLGLSFDQISSSIISYEYTYEDFFDRQFRGILNADIDYFDFTSLIMNYASEQTKSKITNILFVPIIRNSGKIIIPKSIDLIKKHSQITSLGQHSARTPQERDVINKILQKKNIEYADFEAYNQSKLCRWVVITYGEYFVNFENGKLDLMLEILILNSDGIFKRYKEKILDISSFENSYKYFLETTENFLKKETLKWDPKFDTNLKTIEFVVKNKKDDTWNNLISKLVQVPEIKKVKIVKSDKENIHFNVEHESTYHEFFKSMTDKNIHFIYHEKKREIKE